MVWQAKWKGAKSAAKKIVEPIVKALAPGPEKARSVARCHIAPTRGKPQGQIATSPKSGFARRDR